MASGGLALLWWWGGRSGDVPRWGVCFARRGHAAPGSPPINISMDVTLHPFTFNLRLHSE